jgi:ABC-type branched-subunit amino acid transport system ATPase component
MTPPATALSVEQVAVSFGGLVALSDVNFTVGEGEIVSLIGPNGAGKTTAFNVVTGFLNPTHGAVSYRGTALNGLKPHQIADLGLIRTFQCFSKRHRLRQLADWAASPGQGRSSRSRSGPAAGADFAAPFAGTRQPIDRMDRP